MWEQERTWKDEGLAEMLVGLASHRRCCVLEIKNSKCHASGWYKIRIIRGFGCKRACAHATVWGVKLAATQKANYNNYSTCSFTLNARSFSCYWISITSSRLWRRNCVLMLHARGLKSNWKMNLLHFVASLKLKEIRQHECYRFC